MLCVLAEDDITILTNYFLSRKIDILRRDRQTDQVLLMTKFLQTDQLTDRPSSDTDRHQIFILTDRQSSQTDQILILIDGPNFHTDRQTKFSY